MFPPELWLLALLVLGGWFAWDSLRVREAANRVMRAACDSHGWLFLDDTVALRKLSLSRNAQGRLQLRRTYAFDYSGTGFDRRTGRVVMLGNDVEVVDLSELLTH
jgi:hypothetical protein